MESVQRERLYTYTQRGHKLRFFRRWKAQFAPCGHDMTVGIIRFSIPLPTKNCCMAVWDMQ
jgi:hypothetical protein